MGNYIYNPHTKTAAFRCACTLAGKSEIQQVCAFRGCSSISQSFFLYFLVFQIKFEHFSSGFTYAVRRHQNASKRAGHGGCLHLPSHHGGKTQHSSHGLRRRRRKSSATANLQQPSFVTPKVRTAAQEEKVSAGAARPRRKKSLSGAVASHYARLLMRGRVMNSYLKLQF